MRPVWFMSQVLFFSVAGDWDPHYLAMLAPAVAVLVGAGVVALWNDYRSPGWRGWILPLMLAGTAGLQTFILARYPHWSYWLTPTIIVLCLAAAAGLVVARLNPRLKITNGYPQAAISVGVMSLLIAPSIWAASAIWYGGETRAPVAGPEARHGAAAYRSASEADSLRDYLQVNQGDAKYLELPPIGWQLFILGSSQSYSTAFPTFLDTCATRLLAEPLSIHTER